MKFSNQNRNRIIALLSMLAAGILIGQIFSTAERTVQAKVQKELADEVLRFHVLANSDSTLDQEMKLCVRNEILEFLQTEMPTGAGAEATKEWVRSHCDEIEQTAEKCLTEKGYDDPVNAAVTTTYFPEKKYQDMTFPAGNYEALRVEIGSAKGHNWWGMLYPELTTKEEREKALQETIVKVKTHSIDYRTMHLEPTDIIGLQKLMEEKRKLDDLKKLHISIE